MLVCLLAAGRVKAPSCPVCSRAPCPTLVGAGKHEVVEGEAKECIGGHEVICGLFPRLSSPHGGHQPLRMVHVVPAAATVEEEPEQRPLRLGLVLSGGQAPGAWV